MSTSVGASPGALSGSTRASQMRRTPSVSIVNSCGGASAPDNATSICARALAAISAEYVCSSVQPTTSSFGRPIIASAAGLTCTTCSVRASRSVMAIGAMSMIRCSEARACAVRSSALRRRSMSRSA
jgi:hypothetical protein